MTLKLTWDDLLIETPKCDPERLLEEWRWLLGGAVRPIVWSKFGDCFLQRQSGGVELLDILGGAVRKVAESPLHFRKLVNQRANQEEWLLSHLVWELHQLGTIPTEGECYALKILLEIHDPFVGPAIRREAGSGYVVQVYAAAATAIGSPLLAAILSRRRTVQ